VSLLAADAAPATSSRIGSSNNARKFMDLSLGR
jgi:hypothetical protein